MPSVSDQIIANNNFTQMESAKTRTPSSKMDSQAFLKLLTEQLKYQDPMNPMDNTDMLAQEAQFATLEQMEQLTSTFSSFSNVYQANSLLGQCVRVEVDGKPQIGVVEGVDLSDKNGASVFVGDRYFPISSITNIYHLSEAPKPEDGVKPETKPEAKPEGEVKPEEKPASFSLNPIPTVLGSANTVANKLGGSMTKNLYEYAKQAINNYKGQ